MGANPPLLVTWAPTRRAFAVRCVDVLRAAIALLVIANLGRIPVFSTGDREAPVLVNDLCVAAFVAAGLVIALARRSFRLDRVGLVALAFATLGAGSVLASAARLGLPSFEVLVSLAYLGRWLAYLAIYLVMVNVVRARDVSAVWGTLESTILAIAGFGIVQAIFLPGFAQLVYSGSRPYLDWDPQGHRLVSTILEPNIAGAMFMSILLVELAQISVGTRVPRWKPLVLFTALVLTLSRSAAIGLVLGIGIIVAVYGIPKRLLRAAAAAFVIALAALPKLLAFAAAYNKFSLSGSAMARLAAWGIGCPGVSRSSLDRGRLQRVRLRRRARVRRSAAWRRQLFHRWRPALRRGNDRSRRPRLTALDVRPDLSALRLGVAREDRECRASWYRDRNNGLDRRDLRAQRLREQPVHDFRDGDHVGAGRLDVRNLA